MDQISTNRFFSMAKGTRLSRQKINIDSGPRRINREYVLSHIQDTVVDMDDLVTAEVKSASSSFFHLVYLFIIHRALIHLYTKTCIIKYTSHKFRYEVELEHRIFSKN